MFTYLNPEVKKRLIKQGQWIQIDKHGQSLDINLDSGDSLSSDHCAINIIGPIPLPVHVNNKDYQLTWYATVRNTELQKVEQLAKNLREQGKEKLFSELISSMTVNSVLLIGDPIGKENPLIRIHSNCLTGDVFGSQRCECGPQLDSAIEKINADENGGMIIYMSGHEGRGIGLWAKAATYLLQDAGENTYQANESLGLPADSRDFSDAAILILYFLGDRHFRLLTNNPKKTHDLQQHGITNMTQEKHIAGVNTWNKRYMHAKQKWGHIFNDKDFS